MPQDLVKLWRLFETWRDPEGIVIDIYTLQSPRKTGLQWVEAPGRGQRAAKARASVRSGALEHDLGGSTPGSSPSEVARPIR